MSRLERQQVKGIAGCEGQVSYDFIHSDGFGGGQQSDTNSTMVSPKQPERIREPKARTMENLFAVLMICSRHIAARSAATFVSSGAQLELTRQTPPPTSTGTLVQV